VFFTAISSNIGRFQQAINVAISFGRKAVFVGRSVQKKCEMAHDLGYLKYPKDAVIEFRDSKHLSSHQVMYLIAGCYGQVGSSLYKLSIDEHNKIKASSGDTLIFSADPAPPYTKESENFIIDNLIDKGVDVHYYDLHEGLYISGHGSQEDIIKLFKIANPKYFIPIGGAIRFMHAYEKLAVKSGINAKRVFKLKPGENVVFENGSARLGQKIPTKNVLVDGLGIGDVGKVVLQDRRDLSQGGVVVAILKVDRKTERLVDNPYIISKGFIFEKQRKDLLVNATKGLMKNLKRKGKLKRKELEAATGDYLESYFYQKTARRPMVLPVIVTI
jgi:ribonuclease J